MQHFASVLAAALILTACASGSASQSGNSGLTDDASTVASNTAAQTRDGFTDAALSPLEDLNLRREEIPPLLASLKQPYSDGTPLTCEQISSRIDALTAVLGPDWDAPTAEERRRTDQIADMASGAALGAVESGATGWIPFRGLVRQASGAAGHQKKVTRAYTLGAQQRAYLKGYGLAMECDLPARPDFDALAEAEKDVIVYK